MEKKVKAEVLAVDHCVLILEGISKIVNKMPDAIVNQCCYIGQTALAIGDTAMMCVFLDGMPDMSGFDLITKIREQNENRVSLFIPCMRNLDYKQAGAMKVNGIVLRLHRHRN